MGKHEFLTPKAIANRIKAKGLQKLRWYCQLCQKQCRDANGFKCHCQAESHLRMMKIFQENPHRMLDDYSKEFERNFMDLLRRRWRTKRVFANKIYNEFIQDKQHTHMNATIWTSLTQFIKYLGRGGLCTVDLTPKGWYIQYNERDPEVLRQQEEQKKREKMKVDDEARTKKIIDEQMKAVAALSNQNDPEFTELKREGDSEKVKFNVVAAKAKQQPITTPPVLVDGVNSEREKEEKSEDNRKSEETPDTVKHTEDEQKEEDKGTQRSARTKSDKTTQNNSKKRKSPNDIKKEGKKPKLSALEEIRAQEELKRERLNRKDFWIHPGIVVKVMNKHVGDGKYYQQKGAIEEVIDRYVAVVKMIDAPAKLKLDQQDLETVIPAIGGTVLIVNGAYRGETAKLLSLDIDNFSANIQIDKGLKRGVNLTKQYEDICKRVR